MVSHRPESYKGLLFSEPASVTNDAAVTRQLNHAITLTCTEWRTNAQREHVVKKQYVIAIKSLLTQRVCKDYTLYITCVRCGEVRNVFY